MGKITLYIGIALAAVLVFFAVDPDNYPDWLHLVYGKSLELTLRTGVPFLTEVLGMKIPFNGANITESLFIGSILDAHNLPMLREKNITHMIGAVYGTTASFPDKFKYLMIDEKNVYSSNIRQYFHKVAHFIDANARLERGRKVMVFCDNGYSLSAAFIIAWLMSRGQSRDTATVRVKVNLAQQDSTRAPFLHEAQIDQLRGWENEMRDSGRLKHLSVNDPVHH